MKLTTCLFNKRFAQHGADGVMKEVLALFLDFLSLSSSRARAFSFLFFFFFFREVPSFSEKENDHLFAVSSSD